MITDKIALKGAREETHAAVQLIAIVPRNLLTPDPTDGSASLIWDDTLSMLTTELIDGFRIAFELITQEIHIYKGTSNISTLTTIDNTFDQVYENLKKALSEQGLDGGKLKKELPYELPESVMQLGTPFKKQNEEALSTLTQLYTMTSETLQEVFSSISSASDIRCWPHHYDLATLVTIVEHTDPEEAKSIGFGFSPGDGGYEEPYFYLTPWPYPSKESLYEIEQPAFWNMEGWVGGVLKANDLNDGNAKAILLDFFKNGDNQLKEIL